MNFTAKGFAGFIYTGLALGFSISASSGEVRMGYAAHIEDELGLSQNSPRPAFTPDWANPDVDCIENQIPKFIQCLDLSGVVNPVSDLPTTLTPDEVIYWSIDHKPDLNVCRAREVDRREKTFPGSMTKTALAWAWMWNKQADHIDEKLLATYEAAEAANMPPQILFGALKQESLLSDLGISVDGGNYSCGIGQTNVGEWCRFMNSFSDVDQIAFGWPVGISCAADVLPSEIVKSFYDIALKKLGGRPDYELTPKEFAGILYDDVVVSFPPAIESIQKNRFTAISSFVKNCSDSKLGIAAKGKILNGLFSGIPQGLKDAEKYPAGTTFPRSCMRKYQSPYFPLHTGWLLADAVYNAGEREISLLQHYFRMTVSSHESGSDWKTLTPHDLIEALYWGGKWNSKTKKIEYKSVYGIDASQTWFKSCVVQRHIARVIQYATLPGAVIANSLETIPCAKTDPSADRQKSSGKK